MEYVVVDMVVSTAQLVSTGLQYKKTCNGLESRLPDSSHCITNFDCVT